MPAVSNAQFRLFKGICEGTIPKERWPEGMTREKACEFVEGQSPKGLPEKVEGAARGAVVSPGEKTMGELTYKRREALPGGAFVFPGERRYPIHDVAHARNALARVSQHGTADEKAKVRAAVRRKFPSIDVSPSKAAQGKVLSGPSLVRVGKHDDEYGFLMPGSVIAPMRKGEKPTMAGGLRAVLEQLFESLPEGQTQGMQRGGVVNRYARSTGRVPQNRTAVGPIWQLRRAASQTPFARHLARSPSHKQAPYHYPGRNPSAVLDWWNPRQVQKNPGAPTGAQAGAVAWPEGPLASELSSYMRGFEAEHGRRPLVGSEVLPWWRELQAGRAAGSTEPYVYPTPTPRPMPTPEPGPAFTPRPSGWGGGRPGVERLRRQYPRANVQPSTAPTRQLRQQPGTNLSQSRWSAGQRRWIPKQGSPVFAAQEGATVEPTLPAEFLDIPFIRDLMRGQGTSILQRMVGTAEPFGPGVGMPNWQAMNYYDYLKRPEWQQGMTQGIASAFGMPPEQAIEQSRRATGKTLGAPMQRGFVPTMR